MAVLKPKLKILPPEQQALWPHLRTTPEAFTLYGGTAISLRYGHRKSVDFDFFGNEPFEPQELMQAVPYLFGAQVLRTDANTLTCEVDGVSISFFGVPNLKQLQEPDIAEGPNIKVASDLDLMATKCSVVQLRATWKDYRDIIELLKHRKVTLSEGIAAAQEIYGEKFNPMITLAALTYFDEPDLKRLTTRQRELLVEAVQNVNLMDFEP